MISLFDQDRTGRKQLKKTIEYGRKKIKEVNERIDDLMQLKEEMEAMLVDLEKRLRELEGSDG
jgi:septal ring factor EnvC (AmiA/AmiB activator)